MLFKATRADPPLPLRGLCVLPSPTQKVTITGLQPSHTYRFDIYAVSSTSRSQPATTQATTFGLQDGNSGSSNPPVDVVPL